MPIKMLTQQTRALVAAVTFTFTNFALKTTFTFFTLPPVITFTTRNFWACTFTKFAVKTTFAFFTFFTLIPLIPDITVTTHNFCMWCKSMNFCVVSLLFALFASNWGKFIWYNWLMQKKEEETAKIWWKSSKKVSKMYQKMWSCKLKKKYFQTLSLSIGLCGARYMYKWSTKKVWYKNIENW